MLGCLKHQWHTTNKVAGQREILARLEDLIAELWADTAKAGLSNAISLPSTPHQLTPTASHTAPFTQTAASFDATCQRVGTLPSSTRSSFRAATPPPPATPTISGARPKPNLLSKALFCLAQCQQVVAGKALDDATTELINSNYRAATENAPAGWGKVWHKFGIFNMMALRLRLEGHRAGELAEGTTALIVNAMQGFFKSVSMSSSDARHETLQAHSRYPLHAGLCLPAACLAA